MRKLFKALFVAVAVATFYSAPAALADPCPPGGSLAEAKAAFSDPGDQFDATVITPEQSVKLAKAIGVSSDALDAAAKAAYIAVGIKVEFPKGIVIIGWFDADKCAVLATPPIPVGVVNRGLAPEKTYGLPRGPDGAFLYDI